MITIGLIDTYPIAQNGLFILLSFQFPDAILLKARSTPELAELCDASSPDIIILGVNAHHLSGSIKIVRECRRSFPSVPLVAYDQNFYSDSSFSYFKLGVKGHLLKQSSTEELLTCIETVLRGKRYLSPDLHEVVLEKFTNSPTPSQFPNARFAAN